MPSVLEVLKQSLDYLTVDEHWTKHDWKSKYNWRLQKDVEEPCYCLGGALVEFAGENRHHGAEHPVADAAAHAVLETIQQPYPYPLTGVAGFNDTSKHEDVLDALIETINRLEAVDVS